MPAFNTAKDLISFLKEKLGTIYESAEAENLSFLVASELCQVSKTAYVLNEPLKQFDATELEKIVERLLNHEPSQHIFGKCEFYGLPFKVTPDVLIPRPETEELVDQIIRKYQGQKGLKIIDYCTGSGCIAIALAKFLEAEVIAVDVSEKALNLAKENALLNKVAVEFVKLDVLEEGFTNKNQETRTKRQDVRNSKFQISNFEFQVSSFDLIVSNPPYVLESEKVLMHKNVLDYDPHLALFVADSQALIFYERITALAVEQLKKGGELFFEINEQFGEKTKQLLHDQGLSSIQLIKDFRGKDRVVWGVYG